MKPPDLQRARKHTIESKGKRISYKQLEIPPKIKKRERERNAMNTTTAFTFTFTTYLLDQRSLL